MAQAIGGLELLAERMRGRIMAPAEAGYDAARANWNLAVEQRPALVVEAVSAADVAAAVDFADANGIPVAVKATGRGPVHPCDGGLLIHVGRMRSVSLDAPRRRVRVSAGARWADILARTADLGLAPLAGFAPGVGVIGETLGGGLGWLLRKHGSAIESVLAAEVVTAGGRIMQATPEIEPDLLAAVVGGHGNFGVVTALELRLVPARTVVGGGRAYPPARAAEVLRFFRDWTQGLPPEVTASFALTTLPARPAVPPALRGRAVAVVRACALAGEMTARRLIAPLAALGEPLLDTFQPMPFGDSGSINLDVVEPSPLTGHCELFGTLPDPAIDALLAGVGPGSGSPYTLVELRHIARDTPAASNRSGFRDREAGFLLRLAAPAPTPADARAAHAYGIELGRRLAPHTTGATSLNFLGTSNGPDAVRRAYTAGRYRELARLKAVYDPENVFRFGHNIPPE